MNKRNGVFFTESTRTYEKILHSVRMSNKLIIFKVHMNIFEHYLSYFFIQNISVTTFQTRPVQLKIRLTLM